MTIEVFEFGWFMVRFKPDATLHLVAVAIKQSQDQKIFMAPDYRLKFCLRDFIKFL